MSERKSLEARILWAFFMAKPRNARIIMVKPMTDFVREVFDVVSGYAWFVMLACVGGTANYISKVRKDHKKAFSIVELLGEWVLSGFTGLITAYVCVDQGFSFELTAAASGIAGHMGGRGVFILEQWILGKTSVTKI